MNRDRRLPRASIKKKDAIRLKMNLEKPYMPLKNILSDVPPPMPMILMIGIKYDVTELAPES